MFIIEFTNIPLVLLRGIKVHSKIKTCTYNLYIYIAAATGIKSLILYSIVNVILFNCFQCEMKIYR